MIIFDSSNTNQLPYTVWISSKSFFNFLYQRSRDVAVLIDVHNGCIPEHRGPRIYD